MAIQLVPGGAQVSLIVQQPDGSLAENSFNVYNGSDVAWTSAHLTDLATAFSDWFVNGDGAGNTYQGFMTELATLVNIVARDLTVEDSTEVTITPAVAGTNSTTPLPNGCTWAVTHRTGLAGRVHRGRSFLIGLTEGSQSSSSKNQIDSATGAFIISAFGSLIAAVTAAGEGWAWSVLSRRLDGEVRPTGVLTPITAVGYSNFDIDYQRRRAPGHNRKRR